MPIMKLKPMFLNRSHHYPILCSFQLDISSLLSKSKRNADIGPFNVALYATSEYSLVKYVSFQLFIPKKDDDTEDLDPFVSLKLHFDNVSCKQGINNFPEPCYDKGKTCPYKVTFHSTTFPNTSEEFSLIESQLGNYLCVRSQIPFSKYFTHSLVVISHNVTSVVNLSGTSLLFKELFNSGKYSDLKIVINDTVFNVHKNIVCSRSSVLEKMIEVDMKEKLLSTINLSDRNPDVVKELLRYVYTQECNTKSIELFQLAHYLDIKDLLIECELHFIQHINFDNIVDLMYIASNEQYELRALNLGLDTFIKSNQQQLVELDDYVQYLANSIEGSNVLDYYKLAEQYKLQDLKEKLDNFIKTNGSRLIKDIRFKEFLEQHPKLAIEIVQHLATVVEGPLKRPRLGDCLN